MKSIWREIILSLIMGMILPGIVLNWAVEVPEPEPEETVPRSVPGTQPQLLQPEPVQICLRDSSGGVQTMGLEEYLVGVVLSEMPAAFHPEAKKAQSVAARTFAAKAAATGGKHGDGSVCADPGCCQAYISPEAYLNRGGTEKAVEQARQAVEATSGYVLMYEGSLIEATYFSCSGGYTEDAVAVWGTEVAYLRSTPSPGEENAVHYSDTVQFTRRELEQKLGISLPEDSGNWVKDITYTAGGGVDKLSIGGISFRGTEVRKMLGLRSTAFTLTVRDGNLRFETRGFGHRVGMSQYGAEAMAEKGSTYQQILAHYYRGTSLELTNAAG